PAPSPSPAPVVIQDTACRVQYLPTDVPLLTGADPKVALQWHLNNDGSVSGRSGEDLKAFSAWQRTRGEGVRIAVIDDAIEVVHEDLAPNVVANASYNYRQTHRGNAFPLPCAADDNHGTSVAGLIVARDFNGRGVAGVAPRAELVGYNALSTSVDTDVNEALNRDLAFNAVYNNSWGSPDDGFLHPVEPSFIEAIERGIANGRNGKGAIYVFPAGNGGCYNPDLKATPSVEPCVRENSNYDGYVNKLGVIAACAVDPNGRQPFYGERGANMLVCAPSSNLPPEPSNNFTNTLVTTTAIRSDYRSDFTGTSASTPMVSGVVALMLAANPALTWRDVRLILASSARKNDFPAGLPPTPDPEWTTHFGLNFSHKYGFGVADAQAAVQLAQSWTSVGGRDSLITCGPHRLVVNKPLPDPVPGVPSPAPQPVAESIAVPPCAIGRIEFVEVKFTAKSANFPAQNTEHPSSGDLRIRLTSPQGLVSELADEHICYNPAEMPVNCGAYNDFAFGSVRHMNEPVNAGSSGWTLEVTDMLSQDEGQFVNWSITFYGRP
ncbi:MAG: S8 family serine peptidase, partial [Lautropia sp.]|nr:S8 family serine peptidase [Lautropia sp.]